MDFLNEIVQDSVIKDYLKDFPEVDWKAVIKKTLLYGIHSLRALENLGLASPKFEKIPDLQSELSQMKKNIANIEYTLTSSLGDTKDKKKLENFKENLKNSARTRGTSQRNNREKNKVFSNAIIRRNSREKIKQPPFKLTGKEKPEVKRKIPKYLQNVDSKIKPEVQRSKKKITSNLFRMDKIYENNEKIWEEWKNIESTLKNTKDECNQSSSSSFSEYNAGSDVKEFYKKEFSKLLPSRTKSKEKNAESTEKTQKRIKGLTRSYSETET